MLTMWAIAKIYIDNILPLDATQNCIVVQWHPEPPAIGPPASICHSYDGRNLHKLRRANAYI